MIELGIKVLQLIFKEPWMFVTAIHSVVVIKTNNKQTTKQTKHNKNLKCKPQGGAIGNIMWYLICPLETLNICGKLHDNPFKS